MSQNPTDQEKTDLETLKQNIQKTKVDSFEYMESFLNMPEDHLKHTGHKSIEAGVIYALKEGVKKYRKLIENHLRKYPD